MDRLPAGQEQDLQPPALLRSVSEVVFSTDYKQRRCLVVLMLTALVYYACVGLLLYGAALEVFDAGPAYLLALLCGATPLAFYLVIRSGFNQRFSEPTLTFPQTLTAQSLVAFAYTVTGPGHACTLMLLALVMVFGLFSLRVRTARALVVYTVVLMGIVMYWRSQSMPLVYPAKLQLLYFGMVVTVLTAISQLAVYLSALRMRLKTQKSALEHALARIQTMATHDELTGLPNRRNMMDLLREHAMRRARGGPSFSIAMVDLDHFKSINDRFGHRAGDEALCSFARQAGEQLRNTDIIGRWGGEEFLLLLPETPPGDPNVGIERLRTSLTEMQACAQAPALRLAFSSGLTRHHEGESISETIERADRALYAAKSAGRNRTITL